MTDATSTDGTCHECGSRISRPAITVHRGTATDLQFCTSACHTDWSFERSAGVLKRSLRTDPEQPGDGE